MLKNPFWQTLPVLLRYKRQLVLAGIGALISAACFGAGLSMMLPTIKILLEEKRTLHSLVQDYLLKHDSGWRHTLGEAILPYLPNDQFRAFLLVMGTIAVLSIVGSIGRYIHELITVTLVLHLNRVWRGRVFRRIIHAPMDVVLQRGNADYISRLLIDTAQLSNGYQAVMGKGVEQTLKAMVAVLVAFLFNWKLAILALFAAPFLGLLLRKFAKRIRRSTKKSLARRGHLVRALKESLGGVAVVKVHNAEGYERRRFARLNRAVLDEQLRVRQTKAISGPVMDTLALLIIILFASYAAYQIFRVNVDQAEFMSVLIALGAAAMSLKPLSSLNNDLSEAGAAAERILEATSLPVEPTGVDAPPDAPDLPRHARDIHVDHASFRYAGKDRDAVHDVNLHVPFGTTVAIVGGNGSGKTTLLSLLVRLFAPTGGRVLIDGTDIANVSLRSLRKQIAVVTQQTVLFQGTIAENIAYGRRHVPREKIVAAAKAAFADDFVRVLPEGYDTLLGEDGTGLSGGQRQRLSIARAILRDPAILILDEATSQIDADSEMKINQAIRELRHGRTIFVIAHRLSTVIDADLIVVMEAGEILDMGKHAELMERCAPYRILAQTQLRPSAA